MLEAKERELVRQDSKVGCTPCPALLCPALPRLYAGAAAWPCTVDCDGDPSLLCCCCLRVHSLSTGMQGLAV